MKIIAFHGASPNGKFGRNGIANPERGFRFEIGVGKLPEDPIKFSHVTDQWPFPRFTDDGVTIAQAYCYLTQFWNSEISQEKLDALQADFDRARKDGVKFLLRFAYESDGINIDGPDLKRTLSHIQQLTPIVRKNIAVIYVLQIGWVGFWGEFHSSRHQLEKDPQAVAKIVSATLEMLPPERFTMMRRRDYKTNALNVIGDSREVTPETAYSQAPHARIGFFNDGTLANFWDGCTFPLPPHAAPGNPEFDLIAREGAFLPVDGELFWTKQANDPKDQAGNLIAERFTVHHYTTFSLVHGNSLLDMNPAEWAIDLWKKQFVTPDLLKEKQLRFDPAWFGNLPERSWYEYIRDHLGYRIALESAQIPEFISAERNFTAKIVLKNYGFAAPVNQRKPVFALIGLDGSSFLMPADCNLQLLQPCTPGDKRTNILAHEVSLSALLPDTLPQGKYKIAVAFPDPAPSLQNRPEYCIQLATEIGTENINGMLMHILGETQLQ